VRDRGFTLVELAVAGAIFALLLGLVAKAILGDRGLARSAVAPVAAELRAQSAIERIAAELRMASPWGEDQDHDQVLDADEDTNGNGRLDADWDLPDGEMRQQSLSFNRRIDERDVYGNVLSSGIYSRRVTYRLEGDSLVREWDLTDEKGLKRTRRAVVARPVRGVYFSRKGNVVRVELEIEQSTPADPDGSKVVATHVHLRN
jgi:prepilin-type N-terminal cleavage/methylation domain-containing protein